MNHPAYGTTEAYNPVNHTVIPLVVGLAASTVLTHITGSILMSVAKIQRQYAYSFKACTTIDQKIVLEDKYEGQKANRYFAFYCLTVVLFTIFSWEMIWQQEFFSADFKYFFLMNLAISCIVEWLIIDWIRAILGSGDGTGLGACLKRRGFWYDYSL